MIASGTRTAQQSHAVQARALPSERFGMARGSTRWGAIKLPLSAAVTKDIAMRLKIDLEIPQWTKWLAGGIVICVVLGVGASRVFADTVSVTNVWKAGDTLKADDINKNFADLQAAINRLKHRAFFPRTSARRGAAEWG